MQIHTDKEITLTITDGETVTLKTPSGEVKVVVNAHITEVQAQGITKIGQVINIGTLMLRGEI